MHELEQLLIIWIYRNSIIGESKVSRPLENNILPYVLPCDSMSSPSHETDHISHESVYSTIYSSVL